MATYIKLPGESFDIDCEDISKDLKNLKLKIKEYHKAASYNKKNLYIEIEKTQAYLQEIFNRPRQNKPEKLKLNVLENQFKELSSSFSKIKPDFDLSFENEETKYDSHDDFFSSIVENEELAIHDSSQLREKQYNERKENLEQLHSQLEIVNEMFKDTAKLVLDQGLMLDESENSISTAVNQTEKAAEELQGASGYQQQAKRKLICIFVIVCIVLSVLLAIVLGLTLTR